MHSLRRKPNLRSVHLSLLLPASLSLKRLLHPALRARLRSYR